MKKEIILSDFDGTLTTRDTMLDIIRFRHGTAGLLLALLRLLPWLVMMKLHLYPNGKAKERLLRLCFGDLTAADFRLFAQDYAARHAHLLRPGLLQHLLEAQADGTTVIVITASPVEWVKWFVPQFTVLGTALEFDEKGFTGRLASPNCYGKEKVSRLTRLMPELTTQRDAFHITAYGDSRGDREMLAFADEAHVVRKNDWMSLMQTR